MTTTVVSSPPSPPPTPHPSGAPAPAAPSARPTSGWRSTPGGLRVWGAVAAVVTALTGLLGLLTATSQSAAVDGLRDSAAQLVGLQDARNQLVAADAAATTAFLVGGLEPTDLRASYDAALDAGALALTQLAGSGPEGADGLAQVSADLTEYSGLVAQARANNRQGFPVASAYLEEASTVLREDIVPALDELVAAEQQRVDDELAAVRTATPTLLVVVLLALVALVGVQVWVARRTRRTFNGGLVAATVMLLAVAVIGGSTLGSAASRTSRVHDGSYAATVATSQAFALVNDARSMEAFTLIRRGSGAAYEESFVAGTEQARDALAGDGSRLDPSLVDRLDAWVAAHRDVRALDDAGDWDGAVALVTSDDPAASPALFDDLSTSLTAAVDSGSAEVADGLHTGGPWVGWLLAIFAVIGGLLAWTGLRARREEYR
ncbi:hypothetical protein [Cellulomonas dongxiuzhuiae]|uniref:Secreted protein n=1 Tax=Cellulomonas dongxiuzhuiae TaxID=2819979 RepID=A0ABX8GHJ4_9CELL|nr:hypothetical protein [Cellulomonas dongxiuzhuiae]MBO3094631.1 hypothetical protein [Cellulomonas dongxiuzhuiae]QWC15642.1 hypothetical protein KKR89_15340 [Cellulomonas dongxiuzhuiae]